MPRPARLLAALALSLVVAAGCSEPNPYQAARTDSTAAAATTTAPAGDGDTLANNDFIPEGQNLSDCVGTIQRPDCGSKSKGGWRMSLVFAVLISGLGFIGWRVARQIRARDAAVNGALD